MIPDPTDSLVVGGRRLYGGGGKHGRGTLDLLELVAGPSEQPGIERPVVVGAEQSPILRGCCAALGVRREVGGVKHLEDTEAAVGTLRGVVLQEKLAKAPLVTPDEPLRLPVRTLDLVRIGRCAAVFVATS